MIELTVSDSLAIFRKLLPVLKSIRDYTFSEKVNRFCQTTNNASTETKTKWLKKQQETPEECKRVVSQLTLYIEKADEFNKMKIIAALFVSWVHSEISEIQLSRLIHAVLSCFSEDVMDLVRATNSPTDSQELWMRNLQSANLTRPKTQTFDELGTEQSFELNDLGNLLHRAYNSGKANMTCD